MTTYITAGKATKALRKAGLLFDVVKGSGYFWFDNQYPLSDPRCTIEIPSIYECRLSDTTEEIVASVKKIVDGFEPAPSVVDKNGAIKL